MPLLQDYYDSYYSSTATSVIPSEAQLANLVLTYTDALDYITVGFTLAQIYPVPFTLAQIVDSDYEPKSLMIQHLLGLSSPPTVAALYDANLKNIVEYKNANTPLSKIVDSGKFLFPNIIGSNAYTLTDIRETYYSSTLGVTCPVEFELPYLIENENDKIRNYIAAGFTNQDIILNFSLYIFYIEYYTPSPAVDLPSAFSISNLFLTKPGVTSNDFLGGGFDVYDLIEARVGLNTDGTNATPTLTEIYTAYGDAALSSILKKLSTDIDSNTDQPLTINTILSLLRDASIPKAEYLTTIQDLNLYTVSQIINNSPANLVNIFDFLQVGFKESELYPSFTISDIISVSKQFGNLISDIIKEFTDSSGISVTPTTILTDIVTNWSPTNTQILVDVISTTTYTTKEILVTVPLNIIHETVYTTRQLNGIPPLVTVKEILIALPSLTASNFKTANFTVNQVYGYYTNEVLAAAGYDTIPNIAAVSIVSIIS
jgi:hypothetical protein